MIEVEIIPDCVQSVVTLNADSSEPSDPFSLLGYIGQEYRSLNLSGAFTHTYDGHYKVGIPLADYCGYLTLELEPISTAPFPFLTVDTSLFVYSKPELESDLNVAGTTV